MDIEEKRRKAEAGSCVAQTTLGISYLYGYDVDVNYVEAFRLLSAAANQGASRAVLHLGIMHAKLRSHGEAAFEDQRLLRDTPYCVCKGIRVRDKPKCSE